MSHELTELQAMTEEARSAVELDQQSVGRLSRMDAAFCRKEDDEYGDEIADKRLEIEPMATLCIKCAGLSER